MKFNKMTMIGGLTAVALAGFAFAQMVPGGKEAVDAQEATLDDFLRNQLGMGEEEATAEDDYLRLDLGPKVDVSGIERVPSAEHNQPYRSCEKTPEMQANMRSLGDRGNRAYRDIEGYLSVTNVIATRDCTCEAKIIPHVVVAAFEDRLREKLGIEVLEPVHTRDLYNEYSRQVKIVEAMCGEY